MRQRPYVDRADAGAVLAAEDRLRVYARHDAVVLALPRGGVPVAVPVAQGLGAVLDVVIVRKLGVPGHDELAMGALASVGSAIELVRNSRVADRVPDAAFVAVYRRELAALRGQHVRFRKGRPDLSIRGRVAVLVDDGLATGSTMRAAIAAVRTQQPKLVVVAVPVGSDVACAALELEADVLVCAWVPPDFAAVGQAYLDFAPTTDAEVRRALE